MYTVHKPILWFFDIFIQHSALGVKRYVDEAWQAIFSSYTALMFTAGYFKDGHI